MSELKKLEKDSVPAALEKADRYRLLNDPEQAESICLDILAIEPDNEALKDRIARIEATDAAGEAIVPVTLAEERATNPFLRATEPSVKASVGLAGADDAAVFAEVRRRKDKF